MDNQASTEMAVSGDAVAYATAAAAVDSVTSGVGVDEPAAVAFGKATGASSPKMQVARATGPGAKSSEIGRLVEASLCAAARGTSLEQHPQNGMPLSHAHCTTS